MQVFGRQGDTIRCVRCGADNYPFASFCIACGEPFDEVPEADWPSSDALPEVALSADKAADSGLIQNPKSKIGVPFGPLKFRRRETIIGLLLVVLVVGYAIYDWQRSMAQAAAYKEG